MAGIKRDTPELAKRYDQISDSQLEKGSLLITRMGIAAGDRVLDVGCGTGRLTLQVSKLVGPSGSVLGIDPSPERIRVAGGRLGGHEPENVKFAVGAGEDLSCFPGSSFDYVYYSSVFHWIKDKRAALREAFRVLAPGGLIGMTTADRDDPDNLRAIMNKILLRPPYAGQVKIEEDARQPVNRTGLATLLAEAGFVDIEVELHEKRRIHRTPEEAIEQSEANSSGNTLSHVPESLRARAWVDIARELEYRRTPDGIVVSTNSLLAVARKPV